MPDWALFERLEEVCRALIGRAAGPRTEMFALLDLASLAYHARRLHDAREKPAELHYLAMHGADR